MPDVFISYKRKRRLAAWHLQRIFEVYGFETWYDYSLLPGEEFEPQLIEKIRSSTACVVLWCKDAVSSEWVLKEAREAKALGTYLPVKIDQVELPDEFKLAETIDLAGWDGSPRSDALDRLIFDVGRRATRAPNASFDGLRILQEEWVGHGRPNLLNFPLDNQGAVRTFAPPQPDANLVAEVSKATSFRPLPPAGASTRWPRAPKLSVAEVKFSFSRISSGSFDSGDCVLSIRSLAKGSLEKCRVFVVSISDGNSIYPVNTYVKTKGGLVIGGQQVRGLTLCTRNLADEIGRPPWLLRIEGEPWPLFDGLTYILKIELQSEHPHPTIAEIELKPGLVPQETSARLLNQDV